MRTTVISTRRLDRATDRRVSPERSAGHFIRHIGRRAGIALALALLAVSAFVVWSSHSIGASADRAIAASGLSEDYQQAASALGAEESLERDYRLDPAPAVRSRFDEAALSLVAALGRVARDGNAGDRALVNRVLAEHGDYLTWTYRLFAAVDRGDLATVQRIDHEQTEPSFARIENSVLGVAAKKRELAVRERVYQQRLGAQERHLAPLVFLAGLLLAGLLAAVTRGRRVRTAERARAVTRSLHDELTGLPNRTLLADCFEEALRGDNRVGAHTGLALLDLDRFKEVNDTFGHHYGDELLLQVASRLTGTLREGDTVARLGGDEFAVLLRAVHGLDDVMVVAANLMVALGSPFHVEGVELNVEASIGVVISGEHGQDPATLLQHADIAMYAAKAQSPGVLAYDPSMDVNTPAKVALHGDLRRALERRELVPYYQPKVSVSNGDVVGVEVLVRWQHPERGLLSPDAFMPFAEQTGLIGPITQHVLNAALAQARIWLDAGHPLSVAVNLSGRNLHDESLPAKVAALLALHGVPAELLDLEVTESAIVTEPLKAQRLLEQLSTLGVRISIDDFGAGYTSLSQFTTLPFSEIKIDQSYVMTMTGKRSNTLIVQSLIELGHNLGVTLVAEGVENEETLTALASLGCDFAQGYYVCRPLPVHDFDSWCAGRRPIILKPIVITTGAIPAPRQSDDGAIERVAG